jgi:serine/threonine-protein kinase
MGEVWRARHLALQTRVAIKFLHGTSEPTERARRRFLTEAQVTANLRTRHAVQVFDFGVSEDGRPYLVIELLEGETLDKRIARHGRLPLASTAHILQKAARALERAHALGIVHRDFKPENIMLVADEEEGGDLVKVVDFGIAKLVGDLDATLKTALGSIARARRSLPEPSPETPYYGVGTPYYMAPEQVQDAEHVGTAADIWAFGVVAYECLTGRRPFEEDSIGKLLVRVAAATPPPPASTLAPVPAPFDDWFRIACAREPENRFPDVLTAATALASALDSSVSLSPTAPEPARASPPSRSPLATTLPPRDGERRRPAPTSRRPQRPASRPPAAALPAPLFHRALTAIGAFVAAALAILVAVHDDAGRPVAGGAVARAAAPGPAPLPIDQVAIRPPPVTVDEPPTPPAVPTTRSAPEPPAPPPATPRSAPRRQRPSESTPSAYVLPPLGL